MIISKTTYYKDELGILYSHDDFYQYDDRILCVGVGSGISMIHNCSKNRIEAAFIGIDGSKDQIKLAKMNAKINGVDSKMFILIEGYAGTPSNLYGSNKQHSKSIIDINEIDYDILELDCEGSEIEILNNLIKKPRHIIVEMHPIYRKININDFLSGMSLKGYELVKVYTVNGNEVPNEEIYRYFTSDTIVQIKERKIPYGDGLLVLNFRQR